MPFISLETARILHRARMALIDDHNRSALITSHSSSAEPSSNRNRLIKPPPAARVDPRPVAQTGAARERRLIT